ncbi:MAG: glutathione S-transferase family protein [Proteobacteria bacterium]|nr:glutathione S-transferase family protein [Pseudomonadota bacterium]
MRKLKLKLIIGNRNYSSWSLRGWLALKHIGRQFEEIMIPLDQPETAAAIAAHSPSGLVPALDIDGTVVWESLAIIEALHDLAPEAGLWPRERQARAVARGVAAEMHAGFAALRRDMPMDLRASKPGQGHTEAALTNIGRIDALWQQCRETYGGGGPYLFGAYCGADIMFAPVVGRFMTYAPPLSAVAGAYADTIWNHPDMVAWVAAARAEPWTIDV